MIAWDEDKAVFIFAMDDISAEKIDFQSTLLFALNEKDQITKNEQFNKFYKTKKDMGIWGSTNIIKSIPDYQDIFKNVTFNIFDSYYEAGVHKSSISIVHFKRNLNIGKILIHRIHKIHILIQIRYCFRKCGITSCRIG